MMTPANQVKRGSFGAIVNVQHLTPAGAARIPQILSSFNGYGTPHLRLQSDTLLTADLMQGRPGVHADFAAAFGSTARHEDTPLTQAPEVGFVDLTRISALDAVEYAVAGLISPHDVPAAKGACWARDGMLVVAMANAVRVVPLPRDPSTLAGHLEAELRRSPARPTVDLLASLTVPARVDKRRVRLVAAPAALAEQAAVEWGGPALWDMVCARAKAYEQWSGTTSTSPVPPLPLFVIADFLVQSVEDTDEASVWSSKGPMLQEQHFHDNTRLLIANPSWTGPVTGVTQRMYAELRESLSPERALLVLADLLH